MKTIVPFEANFANFTSMWLLNTTTCELEDFSNRAIPAYAILSHTWSNGEVSFQDMASDARFSKQGYSKVEQTCKLAQEAGLSYAWVDSCCIDKSSSAQLSEAINSMFRWYSEAEVCYVYLEDLDSPAGLSGCRWFTRGFTLQELIAPRVIHFLNRSWSYIGSKVELCKQLEQITRIPADMLLMFRTLKSFSIATRMSWAAGRQTSRAEDTAYCLLGVFDVNMPLLYGEGRKAFKRLQEEVVKRENDLTLFTWEDSRPASDCPPFLELFAPSPDNFASSSRFRTFTQGLADFSITNNADFSVTNNGLYIRGKTVLRGLCAAYEDGRTEQLYALFTNERLDLGIYLRKISPHLFARVGNLPLCGPLATVDLRDTSVFTDIYICLSIPGSVVEQIKGYRRYAVHVPEKLLVDRPLPHLDPRPERFWDLSDRVFLRPSAHPWSAYSGVLIMEFKAYAGKKRLREEVNSLIVLCTPRDILETDMVRIFGRHEHPHEAAVVRQPRHREHGITWDELVLWAPNIQNIGNTTILKLGMKTYCVSAKLVKQTIDLKFGNCDGDVLSLSYEAL